MYWKSFSFALLASLTCYLSPLTAESFTGEVTGNRVRLRADADLSSAVVKELSTGEPLLIVGEKNGFYKVLPPEGTKLYVFRTYVLDDTIEGENVNIRLEPSLEAPIVCQLSTGQKVNGKISLENHKWFEIDPPQSAAFYVNKDYVKRIGDAAYFADLKRKERDHEATRLIALNQAQDRKIEETKAQLAEITEESVSLFKEEISPKTDAAKTAIATSLIDSKQEPMKLDMALQDTQTWLDREGTFYSEWAKKHGDLGKEHFYVEEKLGAVALQGTLEPYQATVKNSPGNFLLKQNNMPVAFLYSTQVDLTALVGKEVKVQAVMRPNNNFAFPAFCVLGVE